MADEKRLSSVVQIDGEDYSLTAKRVENQLTIKTVKDGVSADYVFDGSESKTIEIPSITKFKKINGQDITGDGDITITSGGTGNGDMLKSIYDTNNNGKVDTAENAEKLSGSAASDYAKKTDLNSYIKKSTITVSQSEPTGGVTGDIWFKY